MTRASSSKGRARYAECAWFDSAPGRQKLEITMKLSKAEKHTLDLAKKAIEYLDNGDPLKDVMSNRDIEDAIALLVKIAHSKPEALR